jgi:excisionase family DNA binding protein
MDEGKRGMSLKEWMRYLEEQEKIAKGEAESKESKEAEQQQQPRQSFVRPRPLSWGRPVQFGAHRLETTTQRPYAIPKEQTQPTQQPAITEDVSVRDEVKKQLERRRSLWASIKSPRSQNRLDELFRQTLLQIAKLQSDVNRHAHENPRWKLLSKLLDPDMSIRDVAFLLDVCQTTVRRYTNSGLLGHYRTSGNQRRFKLSHVLNFLMRFLDEGQELKE